MPPRRTRGTGPANALQGNHSQLQSIIADNPVLEHALNQLLHEKSTVDQTNKNLVGEIGNLTTQIAQLTGEKEALVRENEDLAKCNKAVSQLLKDLTNRLMNIQLPPHLLQRIMPYCEPMKSGRDVGLPSLDQHQLPGATMPQNSEYQQPPMFQTHPSFNPGPAPTMGDEDLFFTEPPNPVGDGNAEGVNMDATAFFQTLLSQQ